MASQRVQYIILETIVEGFPVAVNGYRGTQSSPSSCVFVGARNTGKKLTVHRCVSNQQTQQGPSFYSLFFLYSFTTYIFSFSTKSLQQPLLDSIITFERTFDCRFLVVTPSRIISWSHRVALDGQRRRAVVHWRVRRTFCYCTKKSNEIKRSINFKSIDLAVGRGCKLNFEIGI